ncbi:uncharacterized protein LOC120154120 [Hibiscus syriacus]|uniref:uncharacterized protein LOC120154120 n=1 Tax=Hibiscus syriacus TaxID=106335 RepID=UPI001924332E|nr:uncharacterized protein LOC120154120 [Hibiscus syriacus]
METAPDGWCCINTDAAIDPTTNEGTVGCVIRSADGGWLMGFNKVVGISNPLQAELWGILTGIKLARSFGLNSILIQTDNTQAALLINDREAQRSPFPLVHAGRMYVALSRNPREEDKVADEIARLSSGANFQVTILR